MIDRTREDMAQDSRISALERAQRAPKPQPVDTTSARLDRLEKAMADLQVSLQPYDNIVKFIQELRWRGVLPHIPGF